MKTYLIPALTLLLMIAGCKNPEPRRPISVRTGSFIKESVERNKQLLEAEEERITSLIKADSLLQFERSANGYWYAIETVDTTNQYRPVEEDIVRITYELQDLEGTPIYTREETGVIEFKVDKEALFPGIRTGIKLLRQGETGVFYFPSSLAYGYHGDENKIGTNVPLKASVTLLEVVEIYQDSLAPENASEQEQQ